MVAMGTPLEEAGPELLLDCLCPITAEVMREPVVAADGHSYERAAIQRWFSMGHCTSPKTNQELEHLQLVPNHSLRGVIRTLMERMLPPWREQLEARLAQPPLGELTEEPEEPEESDAATDIPPFFGDAFEAAALIEQLGALQREAEEEHAALLTAEGTLPETIRVMVDRYGCTSGEICYVEGLARDGSSLLIDGGRQVPMAHRGDGWEVIRLPSIIQILSEGYGCEVGEILGVTGVSGDSRSLLIDDGLRLPLGDHGRGWEEVRLPRTIRILAFKYGCRTGDVCEVTGVSVDGRYLLLENGRQVPISHHGQGWEEVEQLPALIRVLAPKYRCLAGEIVAVVGVSSDGLSLLIGGGRQVPLAHRGRGWESVVVGGYSDDSDADSGW